MTRTQGLVVDHAFSHSLMYPVYSNDIRLVGANFQLKGHEFQAEPMRANTRIVTFRKATQMAFTEGAVLKVLHSMIHRRWPVGCLYLFPTQDTVTDFSASRFNPLIRDNPETIGQHVRDTNRANLKRIGDGFLYFRSGRLGQEIQGQTKTSAGLSRIWNEARERAGAPKVSLYQGTRHTASPRSTWTTWTLCA